MKKSPKYSGLFLRIAPLFCFAVYLLAVLWYTIGKRKIGYYPGQFDFFWSYRLWMAGDWNAGRAILANIAMFIPFGFLASMLLQGKVKRAFFWMLPLAVLFSACIETAQFVLLRGSFEFDDIFNNGCGACLGALLFWGMRRCMPERVLRAALIAVCAGIVLFCFSLFLFSEDEGDGSMEPLSRGLCFQVEEAALEEGGLTLTGVCFWYEQGPTDYDIVLQSTRTGERQPLQTASGLPRPDVNAYFQRGQDDVKAGFQASGSGVRAEEEYEILLDFGLFRCLPTGVYLTGTNLHSVPSSVFQPLETAGTDLEAIVQNGFLQVYDPAHHVYVYQYQGSLYWIAEEGFRFADNQRTHLELILWTAQPELLPEKSRNAGWRYETKAVYFESCELTGNFGPYRVCVKELPTDYSITSITTGRYSNGWIWQESFWPVYADLFAAVNVQSYPSRTLSLKK